MCVILSSVPDPPQDIARGKRSIRALQTASARPATQQTKKKVRWYLRQIGGLHTEDFSSVSFVTPINMIMSIQILNY